MRLSGEAWGFGRARVQKGYKTEVFLLVFLNEMSNFLLSGRHDCTLQYFGKVLIYIGTLHKSELSKFSFVLRVAVVLSSCKY